MELYLVVVGAIQSILINLLFNTYFIDTAPQPCSFYQAQAVQNKIIVNQTVYYACGPFLIGICSKIISSEVFFTTYIVTGGCCEGHGGEDCLPICEDCDEQNMECLIPYMCTCTTGWTGEDCLEDVDECDNGTDLCEELCHNHDGGYSCSCSKPQVLSNDGYRCLNSVENLALQPGRRNVTLSWDPTYYHSYDGDFKGYEAVCTATSYNLTGHIFISDDGQSILTRIITISPLQPYTEYMCCITPHWTSQGIGPDKCTTTATLEDAPSDSPRDISVISVSTTSVRVQWKPPSIPNGVIISYSLYFTVTYNNQNHSFLRVVIPTDQYLLGDLQPYQLVGISILATTGGGEGPQSEYVYGRTSEDNPGPVLDVVIKIISSTQARVSWKQPEHPNGQIDYYKVVVSSLTNNMEHTYQNSIDSHSNIQDFIGLQSYVPYECNVTAHNGAGDGETVQRIFFTIQSVPEAVSITTFKRESPTIIYVKWSPLTLEESKGFITYYTVVYAESVDGCTVVNKKKELNINNSTNEVIISGLDPAKNFCISVAANTVMGIGDLSNVIVSTYENSAIEIYLSGVSSCDEWIQDNAEDKLNQIRNAIKDALKSSCNCSSNELYIIEGRFDSCTQDVVYKASILRTKYSSSMALVQYIQEIWGVQRASFDVDDTTLYVEQVCIVATIGAWSCLPQRTESVPLVTVVGSSVGAVLGSICIIGLIAVVFVIYKKCCSFSKSVPALHKASKMSFHQQLTPTVPKSNTSKLNVKNDYVNPAYMDFDNNDDILADDEQLLHH